MEDIYPLGIQELAEHGEESLRERPRQNDAV